MDASDNRHPLIATILYHAADLLFYPAENDDIINDLLLLIPNEDRQNRVRISSYFENVCQDYNDEEFRKHFRLTRTVSS